PSFGLIWRRQRGLPGAQTQAVSQPHVGQAQLDHGLAAKKLQQDTNAFLGGHDAAHDGLETSKRTVQNLDWVTGLDRLIQVFDALVANEPPELLKRRLRNRWPLLPEMHYGAHPL